MYDRESEVMVLGLSSTPWNINPSVRKKFKRRLHIPVPNKERRIEILRETLTLQDDELEEISAMCDGYSSSDLTVVVRESKMNILRSALMAVNNNLTNINTNLPDVRKSDVIKSLQKIRSSISVREEEQHLQFQQDFYPGSSTDFYNYISEYKLVKKLL